MSTAYELRRVANAGNIPMLEKMLSEGVDVNGKDGDGFVALHYAMNFLPHDDSKDHLRVVKLLVDANADIEVVANDGQTPLLYAAAEGLYDVVVYLLEQGANVNAVMKSGWNGLHLVADLAGGRLLDFKVKVNVNGQERILTKYADIVETTGAHPDNQFSAYVMIAHVLIQHGIDLNAVKVKELQTPLFNAAAKGCPEIAQMILEKDGVNINHTDKWGLTALHFASRLGNKDVVKLLTKAGADVNIKENYGFTPLHEAAANGHVTIARLLVKHGADLSTRISRGHDVFVPGDTALDIAKKKKHKRVITFLQKAMA